MKRVLINLFGKVQMVGFRYSTLQKAEELKLVGTVENLRDGSVEIEIQGEEENIDKFIEWSKLGPPYANVKKIIVEDKQVISDEKEFKIL